MENTQITADIWNGRWDRHMWEDALREVDEKTKINIDPKLCKKWLSIITTKLFETQSALSRHRFKLSKRLKDLMFERSANISPAIQSRMVDKIGTHNTVESVTKQRKASRDKALEVAVHKQHKRKREKQKLQNDTPTVEDKQFSKRTRYSETESPKRTTRTRQIQRTPTDNIYQLNSTLEKRKRILNKTQQEDSENKKRSEYKKAKVNNIRRVVNKNILSQSMTQLMTEVITGIKRPHTYTQDPTDGETTHIEYKKRKNHDEAGKDKERKPRNVTSSRPLRNRQTIYRKGLKNRPTRKSWHHYL